MLRKLSILLPLALLSITSPASAQENTNIGTLLGSMVSSLTTPFIIFTAVASALGGVFLIIKALLKFKDSSGNNAEISSAVIILAAGVALVALPDMAGVGMRTLTDANGIITANQISSVQVALDDSSNSSFSVNNASIGNTVNCYSHAEPVPCIAKNVADNVVPIGIQAVFIIAFFGGLWGFAGTMFSLTKVQGGRGVPEGFWGKLVFSFVLMNASILFEFTTRTLLGTDGTISGSGLTNSSLLQYDIGLGDSFEQYEKLIGNIFIILALFGAIAMIKGLFVMRSATSGSRDATIGHGLIYVIAGILLANSKYTTCTALYTLGMQNAGAFGFCT